MDKHAIALLLDEIGTLLDLQGENQFRSRAYYAAARAAEAVEGDIVALARSGELERMPGFGPGTVAVVRELINTGESLMHKKLREKTPDGFFEMLGVPGLGPRRIHTLSDRLKIRSLDDLEEAATKGRLAALPGFGVKTQEKILAGVGFVRTTAGRRKHHEMIQVADWILSFLMAHQNAEEAKPAGEARRLMETAQRADFVVATSSADDVIRDFLALPGTSRAERTSEREAVVRLADGFELHLRCVPRAELATAQLFATGSEEHVDALVERAEERGFDLRADGLFEHGRRIITKDEAAVYKKLGLAWVPPELRENDGDIDAAAEDGLPTLVTYEDLKGCFHNHTTYSDGKSTLTEMAEGALERGWRYLGIADHSQNASYAGGLTPVDVARQHGEIDEWNGQHGSDLWLFKGIEADILTDGSLDYSDTPDVLASLDFAVGSVHSSFNLPEKQQTERMLRALSSPYLTFLGHATGRKLLIRKGYAIDIEAVIAKAAELGVPIEINADPNRLDLDWRYWHRAKQMGVRTAINPDAHSVRALGVVRYGVNMARKGWLTREDVVNT